MSNPAHDAWLRQQQSALLSGSVCTHCGSAGSPERRRRGSLALEIGLWVLALITLPLFALGAPILFLLVAVFYTLWRFSMREVCPRCGAQAMIPADTPRGREVLQRGGLL